MSRLALLAGGTYVLVALVGAKLIAFAMPPFQNADELNHALRADQISHFSLLPMRVPDGEQGGFVDSGLPMAGAAFEDMKRNSTVRMSPARHFIMPWGSLVPAGYPNTAIYPPLLYIPAGAAIFAARAFGIDVLEGLHLARLAGALATIALAGWAVALAEGGALWLFTVMLLPMSLALTAAVSQDGPLLACTAMAASLANRLRRTPDGWSLVACIGLLVVIAMARPPYAAFCLILLSAKAPLHRRLLGIGAILLSAVAWSILAAPHVVLPVFPGGAANPADQARRLLLAPWRFPHIMLNTCRSQGADLLTQFVGVLGWLTVGLPRFYHWAARLVLIVALVLGVSPIRRRPSLPEWVGFAGIVAACVGVALIQYLTWTPPGAVTIDGLQGRYFLPPALMLAAFMSAGIRTKVTIAVSARGVIAWPILMWPIFALPLLTVPVVLHALFIRYGVW